MTRLVRVNPQSVALATLLINAIVILQGAVVRITGSGAGCGRDWPRCQGKFIPISEDLATWLEYSHRALSGVALLAGLCLLCRAIQERQRLPGFLFMAAASLLFLFVEALIGAATVLLGLTGDHVSTTRGLLVAFHLLNSLCLMGALALTSLYARPGVPWPPFWQGTTLVKVLMGLGLAGMMVLMFSGGIAALGNTMFPPESLESGLEEDFSASSHPLIRLRLLHPVLGITTAILLWLGLYRAETAPSATLTRRFRQWLIWAYALQLLVGASNLALLGPIPLQLLHLALAVIIFMLWTLVTWLTLNPPLPAPAVPSHATGYPESVPTP